MVKSNKNIRLSFLCIDCKKDTLKSNEHYMLKHEIWKKICPEDKHNKMLCILCAEKRLGRMLKHSDFLICECTLDTVKNNKRIENRFNRHP